MIDKYIEKICKEADISKEEVEQKIEQKIKDLDGLISKEGAIYIVANSLGVEINRTNITTDKLMPGMRNVNINLRILNAYDTIEFNKNDNKGRVKSLWCANDKVKTRVVLWNETVDMLDGIEEGDIISIKNAYTKQNRNNMVEIHCANYSLIEKTDDENMPSLDELKSKSGSYTPCTINKVVSEGQRVEVKANIVNLFQIKFFELCPECKRRARKAKDDFQCETHGVVNPEIGYVLTIILDDGTGSIRTTFFRDQVCSLISKTHKEILDLQADVDALTYQIEELKGDFITVRANSKLNTFSNQIELNVNEVIKEIDLDQEIENMKKLIDE